MTRIPATGGIARRYLHDEVAERLRQLILDGELAPRSRVNEIELAERFGISRTPLREAIKILATEGLLELLPNRGARVAAISETELDDMIEVVAGLEAVAGDLACQRMTGAELSALETLHTRMVETWKRGDEAAYGALNREIHEAIMAAARNPTLSAIYANVSGRIQRTRYTAHKTTEQWTRAIEEHEEMMRLLRAKDAAKLAVLMRDHIRGKRPLIRAAYGGS